MKVFKLARRMDAWRYGHDELPRGIAQWIMPLPSRYAVLVSPRAGTAHGPGTRAGIVIEPGWWVIQADTGCLYAVSDDDFQRKYAELPLLTAAQIRADCERENGAEP